MDAIKWNKLRTKFFTECVWYDSMDGNKIRIDYAPHDLFEWFKREITASEGKTSNEDCALPIPDVIGLLPCPFCGQKPEPGALGDGRFTIKCYECGIVMIQDRKDKLKALWNRRQ